MKKLIMSFICTISLLTTVITANAAKVGLGFDQGFGVAGQFNNINLFVGNNGVSGDYLLEQGSIDKNIPLNYYLGAGLFYQWHNNDEFGIRVPLGLTIPFAQKFDAFAQLSPNLGYKDEKDELRFSLSAAIGIRYAF
jgi:hypothetical protein